jgi:hypothetical protein
MTMYSESSFAKCTLYSLRSTKFTIESLHSRLKSNSRLIARKVCNTIFTGGKCMMRQIHVGNIKIDNHIESDLRKSIPYCQTYIQLLWNIQRMITHWTFSKHKIITFNKKVIFVVINLTLQRNICCESTRYNPDSTLQSHRRPKYVTLRRLGCTWHIADSQVYIPRTSFTYGQCPLRRDLIAVLIPSHWMDFRRTWDGKRISRSH